MGTGTSHSKNDQDCFAAGKDLGVCVGDVEVLEYFGRTKTRPLCEKHAYFLRSAAVAPREPEDQICACFDTNCSGDPQWVRTNTGCICICAGHRDLQRDNLNPLTFQERLAGKIAALPEVVAAPKTADAVAGRDDFIITAPKTASAVAGRDDFIVTAPKAANSAPAGVSEVDDHPQCPICQGPVVGEGKDMIAETGPGSPNITITVCSHCFDLYG